LGKSAEEPSKGRPADKETGEGRALKILERLEKQDSLLWLLNLLLLLVFIFFIIVNAANESSGPLREIFQPLTFLLPYSPSVGVILLVLFIYLFFRSVKLRQKRKEIFGPKIKAPRVVMHTTDEATAFFQITSGISSHRDLSETLELITQESLRIVNGHRSTLFIIEAKSGILKAQYSNISDPQNEQVGQFEEKEVARKTMKQKRSLLLRSQADFSEFFKYGERDRKITSLVSTPLFSQGRSIGALSVALIDEERSFTEKDLRLLATLGNEASIALENTYLAEEVRRGISFRETYEKYLDDILNQLQTLSDEERKRIEEHIGRLLPAQPAEQKPSEKDEVKEADKEATPPMLQKEGMDLRRDERVEGMLRVEFADELLGYADDLSSGGVFIRTPNPLDLGEQFTLKLQMSDGEKPIEVPCKVIWTNKYGKESRNLRRGMGVKFLELSPEVQRRVEEYINQQKNKAPLSKEDKVSKVN